LHLHGRRILWGYNASSDKCACAAAVRTVGKQSGHVRWYNTERGFLANIRCFSFVPAQHDCPSCVLDHGRYYLCAWRAGIFLRRSIVRKDVLNNIPGLLGVKFINLEQNCMKLKGCLGTCRQPGSVGHRTPCETCSFLMHLVQLYWAFLMSSLFQKANTRHRSYALKFWCDKAVKDGRHEFRQVLPHQVVSFL